MISIQIWFNQSHNEKQVFGEGVEGVIKFNQLFTNLMNRLITKWRAKEMDTNTDNGIKNIELLQNSYSTLKVISETIGSVFPSFCVE